MRVVGLVASPRKGMNSDTLVSRVLEGAASAGAETDKVYLNDLDIKPCQACAKYPDSEFFWYKDDMERIYSALQTADAVVIGSPSYYDSVSSQLKLVVDRSNCLTQMVNLPRARTARSPSGQELANGRRAFSYGWPISPETLSTLSQP